MLDALAGPEPRAGPDWVAAVVNQAMGGAPARGRLGRQGRGWRLAFASTRGEPPGPWPRFRAVRGVDLSRAGARAPCLRKCANPSLVLYFSRHLPATRAAAVLAGGLWPNG